MTNGFYWKINAVEHKNIRHETNLERCIVLHYEEWTLPTETYSRIFIRRCFHKGVSLEAQLTFARGCIKHNREIMMIIPSIS